MEPEKDEKLWRIARRRAAFRTNLYSYLVMNVFFWGIWWFTQGYREGHHGYPWPVWISLAWGVGLAFQYFDAYNGNKQDMTQEEYEKLKREQNSNG